MISTGCDSIIFVEEMKNRMPWDDITRQQHSRNDLRYPSALTDESRKRRILADTLGLMLFVPVHATDIQDRDGAPDVLKAIRYRFPRLSHVFADDGYAGEKLRAALWWTTATGR